jgi:hypothetical protein
MITDERPQKLITHNIGGRLCPMARAIHKLTAILTALTFTFVFVSPVAAAVCAPKMGESCCCSKMEKPQKVAKQSSCCGTDCRCGVEAPNPTPAAPVDTITLQILGDVQPSDATYALIDEPAIASTQSAVQPRGPPLLSAPRLFIQHESLLI